MDAENVTAVESTANPLYGNHQPGQVLGFIHSRGANAMLTGGMGMRAIAFFHQYGIAAATGASGRVRHALEQYLGGTLQGAAPCRESIRHAHEHTAHDRYEKDDIGRLREETQALQQQLDQVIKRSEQAGEVSEMGRRRGQGSGTGRGGGGGPYAAGLSGGCVCPRCGHKEPHVAGQPCYQKKRPQCGQQMIRER